MLLDFNGVVSVLGSCVLDESGSLVLCSFWLGL